eukprot:1138994-Pelagomonas_calceolata.AAC.2
MGCHKFIICFVLKISEPLVVYAHHASRSLHVARLSVPPALLCPVAAAAGAGAGTAVRGGKCLCRTGAGSSLLMRWWLGVADVCAGDGRLMRVSGAPCAAAAVAPASAACGDGQAK